MSSQAQDIKSQAGEAIYQAQVRKNEMMSNSPSTAQSTRESLKHTKDQGADLIQQTGMQVKNMAQGAAEAVKATLGMKTDNSPSNPCNPSLPGHTIHQD